MVPSFARAASMSAVRSWVPVTGLVIGSPDPSADDVPVVESTDSDVDVEGRVVVVTGFFLAHPTEHHRHQQAYAEYGPKLAALSHLDTLRSLYA